jgi:hypothetical protein
VVVRAASRVVVVVAKAARVARVAARRLAAAPRAEPSVDFE